MRRFLLVSTLVLLSSCGSTAAPVAPAPSEAETSVTLEGMIRPITAKIYDVGTHLLAGERGEVLAFLSSSAVDLGAHVGEEVRVEGATMPLGSGADILLSVRTLTTLAAAPETPAANDEAIAAAKRLAKTFDPPYTFLESDPAMVTASSVESGITVVRIQQPLAAYLVKLVRKPDPVTGAWTIFAIEEDVPSSMPSSPPSSAPSSIAASDIPSSAPASSVPPSSTPPSSTLPSSTPPAKPVAASSSTVAALVRALPTFLTGTSFPIDANAMQVELTDQSMAYITFEQDGTRGMILVRWTSDPAGGSVIATFVPGAGASWKRASGDNAARDLPGTIYTPVNGTWSKQVALEQGYALYAHPTLQLTLQYPRQWYYGPLAAPEGVRTRIGFSTQEVDDANAIVTLDVLATSIDATRAGYSDVAPVSIAGATGYRGTAGVGTVFLLPTPRGGTYVFTAKSAGEFALETMARTLLEE